MRHRLTVRLPDELAEGIEAKIRRTGQTKSEVVREALKLAGVRVIRRDPAKMAKLMQRAAALRATQTEVVDAAALVREVRGESALRLKLMRLTIPLLRMDLA
jgi:Arc/MetJ-type ribon-helix-helix transcriptional regulator